MEQEQKQLREMISELSKKIKENNKILKGLRSHNRFSSFMKVLYWLVIIGVSFGTWYAIQPMLESALDALQSIAKAKDDLTETVGGIKSLGSLETLMKLIQK